MENESENPFERFITEVEKYVGMWDTIDMKIIAIKEDNNTYYLLGMHTTIIANAIPMSEILLDLEDIIMLHDVKSINQGELNDITRDLENGIIQISGKKIKLKDFGRFDFGRSRSHQGGPLGVDWEWPYFWLRASGSKPIGELINEKEIKTKLKKWGYENLQSACEENLGFMVGGAYSPNIYFVAPIYIITDAQIEENKLIFSVKCYESINTEDIRISYGIEGDTPKHDRLSFTPSDMFSQQDNFNGLQRIIDLSPGTKSIRYWTYYKDEEIDENWIHKPIEKVEEINPKWIVIDSLFSRRERGELIGGKRIFERYLGIDTEVSDSNTFELIILNLMNIAGFHVIFTGKRFDYKGIDILAFSPDSSDVIVISCTITNDIGGKIRTLLPQMNKLKRQLENYELIPAIFSPVDPNDVINSDKIDANEHKVVLLLSPEINDIYRAIQTTSVSEIKEFVVDYIKRKMITVV